MFFQNIQEDIQAEQRNFDTMSDRAQVLARTSGDSRISSQASQLSTRYQTLLVNMKVDQLIIILLITITHELNNPWTKFKSFLIQIENVKTILIVFDVIYIVFRSYCADGLSMW